MKLQIYEFSYHIMYLGICNKKFIRKLDFFSFSSKYTTSKLFPISFLETVSSSVISEATVTYVTI